MSTLCQIARSQSIPEQPPQRILRPTSQCHCHSKPSEIPPTLPILPAWGHKPSRQKCKGGREHDTQRQEVGAEDTARTRTQRKEGRPRPRQEGTGKDNAQVRMLESVQAQTGAGAHSPGKKRGRGEERKKRKGQREGDTGRLAPVLLQGLAVLAQPLVLVHAHAVRHVQVCAVVPRLCVVEHLRERRPSPPLTWPAPLHVLRTTDERKGKIQ